MTPKDRIERCCQCDEPTGRAGRCEDSLYLDFGYDEIGPFCEDCYTILIGYAATIKQALADRDAEIASLKASEQKGIDILYDIASHIKAMCGMGACPLWQDCKLKSGDSSEYCIEAILSHYEVETESTIAKQQATIRRMKKTIDPELINGILDVLPSQPTHHKIANILYCHSDAHFSEVTDAKNSTESAETSDDDK